MSKHPLRKEFKGARLGDARRSARLEEFSAALMAAPADSLPAVLGDGAALEAAYRFLGNADVAAADVLAPHHRETAARCRARPAIVVAHDTTDFVFPGEKRRGLGRTNGTQANGFFAHVALAVAFDQWREPLGTLHLETWTRAARHKASAKQNPRDRQADSTRESLRWGRGVAAIAPWVDGVTAIHVMDREADDYGLFASLVGGGHRFVVRSNFDRRTVNGTLLATHVAQQPIVTRREVPLSPRRGSLLPKTRRIHAPRTARTATLGIRAVAVALARPRDLMGELPVTLLVNVVYVEELDPPAGTDPVAWRLLTTEPVATATDVERVVDAYRCRWRIEEYFKALKTGCAIEKRQLESFHSLENLLAVFMPIAWRVLRLRTLAHADGARPATAILSDLQLRILRKRAPTTLPRKPSVADALVAVAALGGHLKRNGDPGWLTIARGYETLLTLEEGVRLASEM